MEKVLPPILLYLSNDVHLCSEKFEFEDEEFDFQKYFEENCHPGDRYKFPNPRDTLLKYLKQVRESFGFDVDCVPPRGFVPYNFAPCDIVEEEGDKIYHDAANFVVNEMNSDEMSKGKIYEFVELKNVVQKRLRVLLLTFTVKEKDAAAAADLETVQAIVVLNGMLRHWRFKPTDVAAAVEVAAFRLYIL